MLPVLLLTALGVVLWEAPAVPPERVSLERAARGIAPPHPPFQFQYEDTRGTSPKVIVRDATGRIWQVKGGPEGRADAFVTRVVSALGYYADAVWFVRSGRIEGVHTPLQRASGFVARDGSFTYAAFELREQSTKFLPNLLWTWTQNPFTGTRELRALKILAMLVSNWDNKDGRDVGTGSNTSVMETETGGRRRHVYYVNDWGQSLGSWGYFLWFGRSNWNCGDYSRQTPEFVKTGPDGRLRFGYRGQHTADFAGDITQADAQWLLPMLSRITPAQWRSGLRASGASATEEKCFAQAIGQRVDELKRAASGGTRAVR